MTYLTTTGPKLVVPAVFLVALIVLASAATTNGRAEELTPMTDGDLRDISAEDGLRQGFSLQSLERRRPVVWGYRSIVGPDLGSDTPPIGDFLLSMLSSETSEYLLTELEEGTTPRYVFEYTRRPFFRNNSSVRLRDNFFSNSGIDLTTGSIPKRIKSFWGL